MFSDLFDVIALAYLGIGIGGAFVVILSPLMSWLDKIENTYGIDSMLVFLIFSAAFNWIVLGVMDIKKSSKTTE